MSGPWTLGEWAVAKNQDSAQASSGMGNQAVGTEETGHGRNGNSGKTTDDVR